MKTLKMFPLPKEPVFEAELPVGTEFLRVGVFLGKPYIAALEPSAGVVAMEKRSFLTMPTGATVRTDDVKFIGSFSTGKAEFYVFEIITPLIQSVEGMQLPSH